MQIDVTFSCDDGHAMRAVLTMPDSTSGRRLPALVMVYELLGLTDEMKRVARDLASEGWIVLIPDILDRGARPLCIARALRAISKGEGQAVDDLEAARRWLAARPEVDPDRMGVIGFCLGGGFALLLAMNGKYKVAAPFYGEAPDPMPRSCPVVASYGARDTTFARFAPKLQKNLATLGVPHDVKVYPDAGHSFFTHTPRGVLGYLGRIGPLHAEHHEESARDARARVVAFFREHLEGEGARRDAAANDDLA
ncbi:dienelactone hydrolase family protein [Sandaracinus amylolyticus]|uniref:Dienelactone hydrolase family n=1 Tax=Sandaracinus amylolyticus TaxID=927083 RepID=A0A0F6SHZ9_9BACT|nr:dienelactone hydrolase family protein [Sandaracinus amylolyticus]AKF11324.1 Dienelactone hydrolase family [Sandaracinus amylolyticus]